MATIIKSKPGEGSDSVIRRFKKQVLQDGVLTIAQEGRFYKSPSVQKKEKKKKIERERRRRLKWQMS